MSSKLNSIAEPGSYEIRITREFDAPRALVFKAMTDPALVAQWWGLKRTRTEVDQMEVRTGGRWRYVEHGDGGDADAFHGVYHQVDAPQQLVYTFEYEGMPGHVLLATATLEDVGGKTRLTESVGVPIGGRPRRHAAIGHGNRCYRELGQPGRAAQDAAARSRLGRRPPVQLERTHQQRASALVLRSMNMGKVIFENSVSLDGFVAGPNDNPEQGLGEGGEALFAWYESGDTALPLPGADMVFKVSAASARYLRESWSKIGAMLAGRRMFEIAHAWGGNPPGGGPCFILTHHVPNEWTGPDLPFTFVTDGIESAICQAKQAAGDKNVAVSSASVMQQCLAAGLLDEIHLDLAPVLLGDGVRLFERFGSAPVELEPFGVVQGLGVTHLRYRVVK